MTFLFAHLRARLSVPLAILTLLVCVAVNAQEPATNKSIIEAIESPTLSGDQFSLMTNFIRASAKEDKWRETPWSPSIHQGRLAGEASNKPLFIWAMNGDPLGCV